MTVQMAVVTRRRGGGGEEWRVRVSGEKREAAGDARRAYGGSFAAALFQSHTTPLGAIFWICDTRRTLSSCSCKMMKICPPTFTGGSSSPASSSLSSSSPLASPETSIDPSSSSS
jgi:hypothetical protein